MNPSTDNSQGTMPQNTMRRSRLGYRARRFLPVVLIALAFFLIVSSLNAIKEYQYIGEGVTPTNTINVSGEGIAYAIPDIATFSFGAQATAKTVADAQTSVTNIMNGALTKIKADGVADTDIQTTNYDAEPQYSYTRVNCPLQSPDVASICPPSTQTLTGYTVSETVTVKVRDTSKAGTILGDIAGTGVTNISGLTFTVDNPTAVQDEARGKAIADAKTKANDLAKSLGVHLGRIVSFSENGQGAVPIYMKAAGTMAMGSAAVAPEIQTGQNQVTSDVTITYEIH